jgi:hypothetical protein
MERIYARKELLREIYVPEMHPECGMIKMIREA